MAIDRSSLPPNARRWLDRALPPDAPVPQRVLNTQEGEMDIRGTWMPFTAQTHYQIHPLTFVWEARFKVMPGVWIIAEDGHDATSGWGGSKLWGLIPMGGRKGLEVWMIQRVRSLAELPWKPQLALAIPDLEWQDTGAATFDVRTQVGDQAITIHFTLDADDQIVRASSTRYYDVPDGFVSAPWYYDLAEHHDDNGVRIPTSAIATYDKSDGPWTYWRGKITALIAEP